MSRFFVMCGLSDIGYSPQMIHMKLWKLRPHTLRTKKDPMGVPYQQTAISLRHALDLHLIHAKQYGVFNIALKIHLCYQYLYRTTPVYYYISYNFSTLIRAHYLSRIGYFTENECE